MTTKEIRRMSRGSAGFTLIEVLVAVAIMAVLASIGGAELFRQIERRKLMDAAQQTSMLMRLARLEAVKNSSTNVVKIQRDPVFNQFWVVLCFVDQDGNRDFDAGEKQLGYFQIARNIAIAGVDNFTTKTPYSVAVFKSDGTILDTGTFRFANARGDELAVAIPAKTGVKIVLRKKFGPNDYREQGEGGASWTWK